MKLPWKQLGSILLLIMVGISQADSQRHRATRADAALSVGLSDQADEQVELAIPTTIPVSLLPDASRMVCDERFQDILTVVSAVGSKNWAQLLPKGILTAHASLQDERLGTAQRRLSAVFFGYVQRLAIVCDPAGRTAASMSCLPRPMNRWMMTATGQVTPISVWAIRLAVRTGWNDSFKSAHGAITTVHLVRQMF